MQAKVSNRYFENQESKVANESFHRRWSINKQKYVVTQSDDQDKHRKGLYYLIEKRKKKYVDRESRSPKMDGTRQNGIYSAKMPIYEPVGHRYYPGEGVQNKTNLRIKNARQAIAGDAAFSNGKPVDLRSMAKKFTEAYLSMEQTR